MTAYVFTTPEKQISDWFHAQDIIGEEAGKAHGECKTEEDHDQVTRRHAEKFEKMRRYLGIEDAGGWSTTTAADLVANPPETPPELIHGLLYQGGTMMMSGASKSMKTYTMIAAGLAVSAGRNWLGFDTSAAPVLYLNLELQDFAMAHRVKAVASAMGIVPPASFHIANLRGQLVNIGTIERRVAKLIDKTGAGLVIIDPHYKISSASGVEENSNDAQGLLLYRLENTVCKAGSALMLAHHFSKGDKSQTKAMDRAAGGGALARWPDVVMTLTEHELADCLSAEFSLRNFAPVAPFVVRWKHPTWSRDASVNPALLKGKAGCPEKHSARDLLNKLRDGMTNVEWFSASKMAESTYRRKRADLITTGQVHEYSGGFHTLENPNPPKSPKPPK